MGWDKSAVREFVKRAKTASDRAWSHPLASRIVREGLLAREFARVVTGQGLDTMKSDDVSKLWRDMWQESGIEEGGAL